MVYLIKFQLYYRKPMIPRKYDKDCADIHRYEDILFTFPMRRFHQTYHAEEHGVCYKNAVFGYLPWHDNFNITIEANHHIFKGIFLGLYHLYQSCIKFIHVDINQNRTYNSTLLYTFN